MIKPNDITHVRYRGHWIKRDSKKFVELIGKPDLLAKTLTMINKVEDRATEYLDSFLLYPVNGKHYKPKWADNGGTYWGLFQRDDKVVEKGMSSIFPIVIKDATQLPENFVNMTREELENLTMFLITESMAAYNKKTALIGGLREIEQSLQSCPNFDDYTILCQRYDAIEHAFNENTLLELPVLELSGEDQPESEDDDIEIEENYGAVQEDEPIFNTGITLIDPIPEPEVEPFEPIEPADEPIEPIEDENKEGVEPAEENDIIENETEDENNENVENEN